MPAPPSDTLPDLDPVTDPLEEICRRGYGRPSVFDDWLTLMLAALERDDDRYMAALKSYNDRDREGQTPSAELFAHAFGGLQLLMEESNRDILGAAYMQLGADSDGFGQYFTPTSVCEGMTEMVTTAETGDEGDAEADGERLSIMDPACGSGRLLMAASRRHPDARYFGVDKDRMCAKMTALNCCFFKLDATIYYGNSLTVDLHRAWETRGTILGGEVRRRDVDDRDERVVAGATDDLEDETEPETEVEESDATDDAELVEGELTQLDLSDIEGVSGDD